jgi:hypothetical protein
MSHNPLLKKVEQKVERKGGAKVYIKKGLKKNIRFSKTFLGISFLDILKCPFFTFQILLYFSKIRKNGI